MFRKRIPVHPDIDQSLSEAIVHQFYDQVRRDPVLGAIFKANVVDWDQHLSKMCTFWSGVMLLTGQYKGKPVEVHVGIIGITPEQFVRWMSIWRSVCTGKCSPAVAELFIKKADAMARRFMTAIETHQEIGEPSIRLVNSA